MQVHPDILKILKNQILPYVIKIQDFDTPWPAEILVDGCHQHQNGVAMFNIGDRGFLNAEYFGYDHVASYQYLLGIVDAKLIMSETRAEIPSRLVGQNPKTGTIYNGIEIPGIKAYNCEITGWIGGSSDTKMRAAQMTILDLQNLLLPRTALPYPDEEYEFFTMQGITSRNAVLKLEAGDWSIRLAESSVNLTQETGRLYHATITKRDGSPFTLDDEQIVYALHNFLSLQSGRWVVCPTIVCTPVNPGDWVVKRARIDKLTSRATQLHQRGWTATDWQKWPSLFKEFWQQYTDPESHEHLKNTVHHYVEAQRVFDDGSISQALVAAQSTLQALTRWWNDWEFDRKFGPPGSTFRDMLIKAVHKAELGKDSGVVINEKRLRATIKKTTDYRNNIDHGRGGKIEGHIQSVVNCQMHHHNLARLLILAKLSDRDRDARGHFTGPEFTEAPN